MLRLKVSLPRRRIHVTQNDLFLDDHFVLLLRSITVIGAKISVRSLRVHLSSMPAPATSASPPITDIIMAMSAFDEITSVVGPEADMARRRY